jgi:hypothetical protein
MIAERHHQADTKTAADMITHDDPQLMGPVVFTARSTIATAVW